MKSPGGLGLLSGPPAGGGGPPGFTGDFGILFPDGFQVLQTDMNQGFEYGDIMKPAAGNTSTAQMIIIGSPTGAAVTPIWIRVLASGTADIYYDGIGVTPAMAGVPCTPGGPLIELTGAADGLYISPGPGSLVPGNTWLATGRGLYDKRVTATPQNAFQLTANFQPVITAGVNGCAGLLFDGVDDFMLSSTLTLPAPGTTPWSGFIVFRRTGVAGIYQRVLAGSDDSDLLVYNSGGGTDLLGIFGSDFGPTGTVAQISPGPWQAIDFKFSASASDYIRVGSSPSVTGLTPGNAPSPQRRICGNPAAGIELLTLSYAPPRPATEWRAAVAAKYGPTVAV